MTTHCADPRRRLLRGAALILAAGAASVGVGDGAFAQSWQVGGSATVSGSYETNPERDPVTQRSNSEYVFTPSASAVRETPTSTLEMDGQVSLTRTRDPRIRPDAEEYDASVAAEQRYERSTLSADARASQSEFAGSDFDETEALAGTEAAQAAEDDTVLDLSAGVDYRESLSDRLEGTITTDVTQTTFSDDARTDFIDAEGTLGADYEASRRLTLRGETGYQAFKPDGLDRVDVVRASGGFVYAFGAAHTLEVEPGVAVVDGRPTLTGLTRYTQPLSFGTFEASIEHDVAPDDEGALLERTQADLSLLHPVSERTTLELGSAYSKRSATDTYRLSANVNHAYSEFVTADFSTSWRRSERDGRATGGSITTEVVLAPSVTWVLTDALNSRLRYNEIFEEVDGQDRANSRRLTLSLTYNLP